MNWNSGNSSNALSIYERAVFIRIQKETSHGKRQCCFAGGTGFCFVDELNATICQFFLIIVIDYLTESI